jgi:hypothetical protein
VLPESEPGPAVTHSWIESPKDFHYWPQIYTAFEARHLVEHRDGRVDARFRDAVAQVWSNSSWGRRFRLEDLEKVVVEEEDVIATHDLQ